MEIFEKVKKSCDLLSMDEKEKGRCLEKLMDSNSIFEVRKILIKLYGSLAEIDDYKKPEVIALREELINATPFYLVWNHAEAETLHQEVTFKLSRAAFVAEEYSLKNKGSDSVVFLCLASKEELEEKYEYVFGKKKEFDIISRMDEDLLAELVDVDFILKDVYVVSY